jgi:hypothetical protein
MRLRRRLRRRPPAFFDSFRGSLGGSLWAGVLCALVMLAPATARAVVLEVQGIQVDITADSAAEARDRAILVAQRKAFEQLVADVTGGGTAPNLSDAEITALVHDFSITDERASAVRYIATFDFRFSRAGVRDVVGAFAAPVAAAPGPVVIVPVFQAGAEQTLWDEPNPWRTAWARHASSSHVVPTMVPLGDLEDVATIGPRDATGGDTGRLMALARQYAADSALVALAVVHSEDLAGDLAEDLAGDPAEDPAGQASSLTVTTVRHGPEGPAAPLVETFDAMPGESVADLLDRAAAAIHADLQVRWRQEAVAETAGPGMIGVAVPITGLNDWIFVRNRLQNQRLVREADLVTLSRDEVRLNLHYVGELSELTRALQQDGLDLVRDGERWTLLPPGAGPGGGN